MRAGALALALAALATPAVGAADAALRARDATAIADLTRLPFLYEGRRLDRAAFVQGVPTLFEARLSACLAQARPQAEVAGRLLYCAPCTVHLRADAVDRWRLAEFAADGEGVQ